MAEITTARATRRHHALCIIVAIALLTGCGGSQPPIGAPRTMLQTSAIARHAARGQSWMLPEAQEEPLLYVSDANENTVEVYSYNQGQLVGVLSGFDGLRGLCSDKAGHVYVPNISPGRVYEYNHGGKKPIKTLKDDYGYAFGCAVNAATHDLAVTTLASGNGFGQGNVLIFPNGSGKPAVYTTANIQYYLFPSYDSDGNLWISGQLSSDTFAFAELPNGGSELQQVTVNNGPRYPGGVQWDGRYLDIGDVEDNYIERYTLGVSGQLTYKDTITLGGTMNVAQFWVRRFAGDRARRHNYRIVGAVEKSDYESGRVLYWHYPVAGSPIVTITDGLYDPYGVTASFPPH